MNDGILWLIIGGFLIFMGKKHHDLAMNASRERQMCKSIKELGMEWHIRDFAWWRVKTFVGEKIYAVTCAIFSLVGVILFFYGFCKCYAGCSNSATGERPSAAQSRSQSEPSISR